MNTSHNPWDNDYQRRGRLWGGTASPLPKMPRSSRVLELGCGDGKTASSLVLAGCSVTAIDFSSHAAALCRHTCTDPDRVRIIIADIRKTPFRNESFDIVIASHITGHLSLSGRRLLASEVFRLIAPGGTLYFCDFSTEDFRYGRGKETETGTFMRKNGIATHYFTGDEVLTLFSGLEVQSLLQHRWEMRVRGTVFSRAEIVAECKKPSRSLLPSPQTICYGTFNFSPEEFHMKELIFLLCISVCLLVVVGIPAAASPTISSVSPSTGPLGGGTFTITITGSGFDSVYNVLLYRCGSKYGTSGEMGGTNLQVSTNKITAQIDLSGTSVVSGDYDVLLYSNEGVNYKLGGFNVYGGSTPVLTTTTTTTTTTIYGLPGPYGTIYVESSPPGAIISLNGDNQGHAPVTITGLWPGTYTISAELTGYQEYTTITTISGATRSSVYCPLVPADTGNGLYVISTPANANVYLDGVQKGVTPLLLSDPATGTHIIQVRLYGYDEWKSTVEVSNGGTKTISALLNQNDTVLTQGINISSNPGGATIILDGLAKGVTPKTLNNIAAGIHVLEIDYPGYTSWKSTVDVPETEIKDISINLTPKTNPPGWIAVSSSPGNASVTLDGSYVGRTPANSSLNLDTITPGEHTIALELPGYQLYSTHISVSSQLVSLVNAVLIPASGTCTEGALSVTSDPAGATISVDNSSIGISPLTASDIAAGNHRVTITMEGYQDYSTSILVTTGNTSTVSTTLLPVTPSLKTPLFPLTAIGALGIIGFLLIRKPE